MSESAGASTGSTGAAAAGGESSQAQGTPQTGEAAVGGEGDKDGTTPTPSAFDRFRTRISSISPDDKFDNDDAYYDKALAVMDQMEGETKKRKEADRKLLDTLRAEPELEGIVKAVLKGMPIRAAIARYFASEDLTPAEGEEDYEEYKKYSTERMTKLQERDKFEKEVEANIAASETALQEFAAENGLDEAATMELIDTVSSLMESLYKGVLPKDLLGHVYRSKNKDAEVAKALADGKIEGKNEKIEAVMNATKKTGDNIPVFNGGKTEEIKEETPVKKSRLDKLVEREQRKKFI